MLSSTSISSVTWLKTWTRQLSGTCALRWLLLLHLTVPSQARAQFNYRTNDGTITITGGNCVGGDLTIPDTIAGMPVTSIGDSAFVRCNMVSVTIPSTVISIGDYAFSSCLSLTNVTIPSSVASIGRFAFSSSWLLAGITIPSGVTNIGDAAFYLCESLKNVTIPSSVVRIGHEAFSGCARLSAITVDSDNSTYNSVDGILFNKARTKLIQFPGGKSGNYSIPSGVTSIGNSAVSRCAKLLSVTIPNGVTNIDHYAFNTCTALSSVMIPGSVISIGNWAFHYCTSLKSVTIPRGVTWIGTEAFRLCSSLTSVTIGSSVTNIEPGAFLCPLVSVYFQGNAPPDLRAFSPAAGLTIYYLPGTTGWGPTYGGHRTVLWNPEIKTGGTRFGPQADGFGFDITGTSNLVIVVEVCPDLTHSVWTPVGTNTLTDGLSYFSDPRWTSRPTSFYRLRSP